MFDRGANRTDVCVLVRVDSSDLLIEVASMVERANEVLCTMMIWIDEAVVYLIGNAHDRRCW